MTPFPPPPPRRQRPLAAVAHLGHIVARCPTELTELVLALILVQWGLVLALPGDSFGAPVYRALQATGVPEVVMGLAAIAVGLGQVVALASRRRTPRVVGSALAGCCFFAITSAILVVEPVSTAAALYGTLALASAVIYIRHRDGEPPR
ncbi:MAG: hypothetical protein WCI67_21740 [Chloroflexales bacterium]